MTTPPIIKGGQGRSDERLIAEAWGCMWIFGLAFLIFVIGCIVMWCTS